jgi:hypothetical protein
MNNKLKKVFTLLDDLFLNDFELDFVECYVENGNSINFEMTILNINTKHDKLANLQKIENIKIIDFSGENLFDFIYQNTNDATYFIMPNLISNFSSFRKSIESFEYKSDDVFLKKNYRYNALDKALSCVRDLNHRMEIKKQFLDSNFDTTLYSSDFMYGSKDFYKSLCDCFKEMNNSGILIKESHLKFDLILNLTLLKNKFTVKSV